MIKSCLTNYVNTLNALMRKLAGGLIFSCTDEIHKLRWIEITITPVHQ
jgi:hypothetical protein